MAISEVLELENVLASSRIEVKLPPLICDICAVNGINKAHHATVDHEAIKERIKLEDQLSKVRLKNVWGYDWEEHKDEEGIVFIGKNLWNHQSQIFFKNLKVKHETKDATLP